MRRMGSEAIALLAGLMLFTAAPVLAANEGPASDAPARVEMTDDGLILLTPGGVTLYTYGPDSGKPGESLCTNVPQKMYRDPMGEFGMLPVVRPDVKKSCVDKFPPYLADAQAKPNGDFSMITRPEGTKQWAYFGRPLYTSTRDQKPGDRYAANFQTAGGGRGRGWSFAQPPMHLPGGLKLARFGDELVLATENGKPAYTAKNGNGKACQGCEELFKPIRAAAMAKVSGDWSIVDAGAGRKQFAYKGKPLFAAPEGMDVFEIEEVGGWEPVAFRVLPGRPAEIGTRFTLVGDVYTDKNGQTLYTFSCSSRDNLTCDDPGEPAGYWSALCGVAEECARRWLPYIASADAKPVGDWSIVNVAYPAFSDPRGFTYGPELPRVKAWAYRGKPLYTYIEDQAPGDIWGDRIKWQGYSSFGVLSVPGRVAAE